MNTSLRSKYLTLLLVFLCLTSAYPLQAVVFYVDAAATGSNNGSSWTDAYNYLQDALAAAGSGSEIWVAQGTYKPDANTSNPSGTGDRSATFQLKNGVALYGGFPTGGGSRDPNTHVTTLSGDIGVSDDCSDNSYHVVTGSGTDSSAALDGFTITKGYANGSSPDNRGAGMYNSSGSPMLTNCSFTGNEAYGIDSCFGGGIYNANGSPTLTDCSFSNNSANCGSWAGYGGGIYNSGGSPTLTNCTFSGNSASSGPHDGCYGGGLCNDGGNLNITNCMFFGNQVRGGDPGIHDSHGGGIYNDGGSSNIINCTLTGNSGNSTGVSSDSGGGIYSTNSSLTVTDCILWGNTSPTGPQIYNSSGTVTVTFSDVQGGWAGTGNINADPCFVTGPCGNYYLSQIASGQAFDSPCVDTGSDTAANLGMDLFTTRTDQLPDLATVDMGYHYTSIVGSADIYKNWHVDFFDFALLAADWLQCSNPHDSNCSETGLLVGDIIPDFYVDIYDLAILTDCWLDCYVTEAADLEPPNGEGGVDPDNTVLTWSAGDGAVHHDVYLGTDSVAVANAGYLSEEFKDTVSETSFDPNILDANTTYYWRIDEIGPVCSAKGAIWSFTTWSSVMVPDVGWWKFDDGSGTTAYDSAGDNNGVLVNGPLWTTGQIDGALSFDGSDDYVSIGNTVTHNLPKGSFTAWVNPADLSSVCGGWNFAYVIGADSTSGGELALRVQGDGSGWATVQTGVPSGDVGFPAGTISVGNWHHIAITWDGSYWKLYINGIEKDSKAFSQGTSSNTTNAALIGKGWDGCTWNGKIDDVRLYDSALSAGEIWWLYREGLWLKASNPNPPDEATGIDPDKVLGWLPGKDVNSHSVYLGTDCNDVNDANASSPEYKGSYDVNIFDPCTLDFNTTYYWRIDEINDLSVYKGDTWSFTTWSEFDPNLDLVSLWKFDEGSGTIAYDSADSHNGTLVNGPVWTSGKINGALSFDGSDDYVDLGTDPFATLTQGTITAWIKPGGNTGTIVSAKIGTGTNNQICFRINSKNLQTVLQLSSWVFWGTGGTVLQTNTWYHVAYTTDSTGNHLYVNGSSETVTYQHGSAETNAFFGNLPAGQVTSIGVTRNYGGQDVARFSGVIDDVRIYDRALSAVEIQQLYQDGL